MNISNDIHICGVCKKEFDELSFFLNHKKQCLNVQAEKTSISENEDVTLVGDSGLYLNETLFDLSVFEDGSLPIFLQYCNEEVVTDNENDEKQLNQIHLNQNEKFTTVRNEDRHEIKDTMEEISSKLQEHLNDTDPEEPNELIESAAGESTILSSKQRHVCSICNIEMPYRRDLKRHLRTHTGEKPFQCNFCDKKFARKDKLVTHVRIHTDDRRYKCEKCDYTATNCSALWSHRRTHSGDRPHRCQICSYQARNTSHLALHLRTHTGDRPFFCKVTFCRRKFKTSMDLNRHSKAHKVDSNKHYNVTEQEKTRGLRYITKGPKMSKKSQIRCSKSHVCPFCEAAFVRADSLRSHVKMHS